jgi:hypothetical protein
MNGGEGILIMGMELGEVDSRGCRMAKTKQS